MKLGFIVNPMAGIGGRVALKGSDGEEIISQALEKGAKPLAQERAGEAMRHISGMPIDAVLTVAGDMGETVLDGLNINNEAVFEPSVNTSAVDTRHAVRQLCERDIDLLIFGGGDGTARDV